MPPKKITEVFWFAQVHTYQIDLKGDGVASWIFLKFTDPKFALDKKKKLSHHPIYFSAVVDGGWASWEAWGGCAGETLCASVGNMTRVRLCNNPEPENGGLDCPGPNSQLNTTCTPFCAIGLMIGKNSCTTTHRSFRNYNSPKFGDSEMQNIFSFYCSTGGVERPHAALVDFTGKRRTCSGISDLPHDLTGQLLLLHKGKPMVCGGRFGGGEVYCWGKCVDFLLLIINNFLVPLYRLHIWLRGDRPELSWQKKSAHQGKSYI